MPKPSKYLRKIFVKPQLPVTSFGKLTQKISPQGPQSNAEKKHRGLNLCGSLRSQRLNSNFSVFSVSINCLDSKKNKILRMCITKAQKHKESRRKSWWPFEFLWLCVDLYQRLMFYKFFNSFIDFHDIIDYIEILISFTSVGGTDISY